MAVDSEPGAFLNLEKSSALRKGFYFSFDAFLALAVMSASLLVVAQSGDLSFGTFESETVAYQKAALSGQDAMKLASRETFREFNSSFEQELVDETVMTSGDLDRTILDGISLLWAARNFSYAERAAERYFDSRLPSRYDYRLQVTEGGNTTRIFQTSAIPPSPEGVSSISRLVSGHRIDRPSEGFQSRARATSVTKNETRVISIPAMGNANQNGKLEVSKEFVLPEVERFWNGTFYIDVEYNSGQSVEQFKVNGVQKKTDLQVLHDNGDTMYAKVDITGELQEGRNSIYIRIKGKSSQTEPNEFQPGTMVKVKYRKTGFESVDSRVRHRRIYFEDLLAETPGNAEAGIFKVESFELPRNAEFMNASVHLEARSLSSTCGYSGGWFGPSYSWDVKTIFNGDVLEETCASGTFERDYSLDESQVREGTNVFTVYLENYGNSFWGGDDLRLFSDFQTSDSSHIDVWYNISRDDLRFGEIKVTAAEQMGGGTEETKVYEKVFQYGDLANTEVYIAQKYSNTVHLDVDDGTGYTNIFTSPGVRATPTRITVSDDYYNTAVENRVRLWDEYNQMYDPDIVEFYPESTFQWTVWAPSQVGYGQLFNNRSAAVKDAKERLRDRLGPFVDATGISQETLSTGDQPYLWGPASVKLVVWQ